MQQRLLVTATVATIATLSVAAVVRQRRNRKERREFAARYAKQLRSVHPSQQTLGEDGSFTERTADVSGAELEEDPLSVKVIYGSESGNAEALARGLVMTLRDRGVPATLIDPNRWAYLEDYLYQSKRKAPLFQIRRPSMQSVEGGVLNGNTADGTPGVADGKMKTPLVYIFVLATAGEGEPTGNFMALFQEMQLSVRRGSASSDDAVSPKEPPFRGIHYAVFGLGDSSYMYYCRSATDTNTLLKKGGGTNLHRVGFGDARSGLQEDVFEEWQEKVMLALEKCGFAMTTGALAPPKPEYEFQFLPPLSSAVADPSSSVVPPIIVNSEELPFPPPPALLEPSLLHPARIRLIGKTRLTAPRESDNSAVFRFCFDTEGTGIHYQAGDHFGFFPTNPPAIMARCAQALGITEQQLQTPVELCEVFITRGSARNILPARVPLRVVLQRYVDLGGRPRKSTLRVLAKYCTDAVEQAAFMELIRLPGTHAGAAAGAMVKPRTVVDYLERFPSCCGISLGHFIEIMPRIQPRYYSIASDRLSHGTHLEIIMRVLTDGLASSYLANRVQEGEEVFGYVRISIFHLPPRIGEKRPLLMIGPGTGAAAMVGLCFKKEALMRKRPGLDCGPTMFLFGAQHRATEYFVAEEIERWTLKPAEAQAWDVTHRDAHAGIAARRIPLTGEAAAQLLSSSLPVITTADCAFSRDQEEKIYVTTLMEKHKDTIYEMLTSTCGGGCLLYISGDASFMAKDVNRALLALLQEKGGMTRIASLEFLRNMETDRRYMKDVY